MSNSINRSINFGQTASASSQGVNEPNAKPPSYAEATGNDTSQLVRTPSQDTFGDPSAQERKKERKKE